MINKTYILILSISVGLAKAKAQEVNTSFIQSYIDSVYQTEKVPGIFVGVLNNGSKNYYTAGFANPDNNLKFDSSTFFEIGSITKTFTAYILTAVLKENKINENSKIINYLPDSVKQNSNLATISFLSLMNHTSGLPRLPENLNIINQMQPYEDYSSAKLFEYLKTCTLKTVGKYNYSNLGGGLAGVLAEIITHKTYAQLLDQYIFLPFKMVSSDKAISLNQNKSQGYLEKGNKSAYWNMNVLAPAGGLICNGSEMLTYLQNMCSPKNNILKSIVDTLTAQTFSIVSRKAIGRGWHIFYEENNPPVFWHNGGTYGFSTFCAFSKVSPVAIIVAINQYNKNVVSDRIGIRILKKMLGE